MLLILFVLLISFVLLILASINEKYTTIVVGKYNKYFLQSLFSAFIGKSQGHNQDFLRAGQGLIQQNEGISS